MGVSQNILAPFQAVAAAGLVTGYMVMGTNAADGSPLKIPLKPFSATPAMVNGTPLIASLRPTTRGSPAKRLCQ